MVLIVLIVKIGNKEHLALRNNFAVTKKSLITKFDCSSFLLLMNLQGKKRNPSYCYRWRLSLEFRDTNANSSYWYLLTSADFSKNNFNSQQVAKLDGTNSLSIFLLIEYRYAVGRIDLYLFVPNHFYFLSLQVSIYLATVSHEEDDGN